MAEHEEYKKNLVKSLHTIEDEKATLAQEHAALAESVQNLVTEKIEYLQEKERLMEEKETLSKSVEYWKGQVTEAEQVVASRPTEEMALLRSLRIARNISPCCRQRSPGQPRR